MNNEQLQQQVNDMKAKLAEMEALLNQPVINYWQPEEGEFYFFLDNFNTIDKIRRASDGLNETRYRSFKTEAEAKKYAEYSKAEEILRKAIAEANKGWLPDWSTHIEDKWCITIEAGLSKLSETCVKSFKHHPTFMYIKSGKLAAYLMNTYRKEFITYLSY